MKMRDKCEILGLLAAFSIESEDIVLDNFILKVRLVEKLLNPGLLVSKPLQDFNLPPPHPS